ncbi:MAG TPA: PstS family phosphate ABC transporter substrate-binding protein [Anaerohalosphaeraceae bacterium]|mgnify:FL=1|nr:PstS family phosphate ABC transporter substrate-binding protein [Anaerohalosphaeraceae bacterium]
MKRIVLGLCLAGVFVSSGCGKRTGDSSEGELNGTISISGAWALYPMAVRWAEEFRKIHPGVRIDISAGGAGKGMADCLSGAADLGMLSREIHNSELEKGAWPLAVVKDAVVAVANRNHPAAQTLLSRGLTRQECIDLWITGRLKTWGQLSGFSLNEPIHVYTRSDACGAAETWAKYLGKNQEDLQGIGVFGDPGLAEAVRKDPLGIGYNNVNYAYDAAAKKPMDGLMIVPLDLNENGRIDPEESFYGDRDEITGAIGQGRYPSPPARLLYLVSKGRPARPEVLAFLEWILRDGQAFADEAGYVPLSKEAAMKELEKLTR